MDGGVGDATCPIDGGAGGDLAVHDDDSAERWDRVRAFGYRQKSQEYSVHGQIAGTILIVKCTGLICGPSDTPLHCGNYVMTRDTAHAGISRRPRFST